MGIFGIAKKGFGMLGKSSITCPTINSVKPKANKDSAHKIELKKIPGRVQRIHAPMLESSDKTLASWRQVNQKLSGEKKTKSGISKGKDKK
jgi:hypothetical protein